jgi:hypothetical protein
MSAYIENMVLVLDVVTSVRCSVELPGQKAPIPDPKKRSPTPCDRCARCLSILSVRFTEANPGQIGWYREVSVV